MLDYEFLYVLSIPIYVIFIWYWIYRKKSIDIIFTRSVFYFYIVSVIAVTLFPIPFQWLEEIWKYGWGSNNFIPFHSILDILLNKNLPAFIKAKQIIGNIVLFLPLGFFVPILWKNKNTIQKLLWVGIIGSLWIEITQFFISSLLWFNYKNFDIDDIFLNTLGCIIWYILYKLSFLKEKS